jgi:hypothetical protein
LCITTLWFCPLPVPGTVLRPATLKPNHEIACTADDFRTVACNADDFRNTTVNSDLHFISWNNPPMQHPHYLTLDDWDRMLASARPSRASSPATTPCRTASTPTSSSGRRGRHGRARGMVYGSYPSHVHI